MPTLNDLVATQADCARMERALRRIIETDQREQFITIECDPAGNTMVGEIVDGPCAVIARAALAGS
jgi:hypothetical protein